MIPVKAYDDLCDLVCGLVGRNHYAATVRNCREKFDPDMATLLERVFRGDRAEQIHGADYVATTPEHARELIEEEIEKELATPDPFEVREAILVTSVNPGTSLSQVFQMLGQERVDEAEFIGVENPDRTVKLAKMLNEPGGHNPNCVPRSWVPLHAVEVSFATSVAGREATRDRVERSLLAGVANANGNGNGQHKS